MSRILAMIEKGRELGLPEKTILAMIEAGESAGLVRTARQERNARYYDKKKAERLIKTSEQDVLTPSETVLTTQESDSPSRARSLCEDSIIKNKTPNGVLQKDEKKSKGSRITGCWSPENRDWQFAISELGSQSADRELAKFRDYWIGRAGAGGVKADWSATWRNWVRKAADDRKPNQRAGPNGSGERPMTAAAAILQKDREKSRNERPYAESQHIVLDALPAPRGAG